MNPWRRDQEWCDTLGFLLNENLLIGLRSLYNFYVISLQSITLNWFEKLKDVGLIVPFGTTPFATSYSSSFSFTWALFISLDSGTCYWLLLFTLQCHIWFDWFWVGQLSWTKCDYKSLAYTFYACCSPTSWSLVEHYGCWWYSGIVWHFEIFLIEAFF